MKFGLLWIHLMVSVLALSACGASNLNEESASEQSADQFQSNDAYQAPILAGKELSELPSFAKSVVLIHDSLNEGLCSGALIDQNVVLTAAHCVSENPRRNEILFTTNYFGRGIPLRRSKRTVIHDEYLKYKGFDRYDLGLIYFEGSLPEGYKPIQIADEQIVAKWLESKTSFVAFGYGDGERSQRYEGAAGVLRTAEFKALDFNLSQRFFSIAQEAGPALCHGDSGGPAMLLDSAGAPALVGVASAVISKKEWRAEPCRYQALYMNALSFKDWIQKQTQLIKSTNGNWKQKFKLRRKK